MDGIALLARQLVSNDNLKVDDREVVLNICELLRLKEESGLINTYLCQQVEAEAASTYLVCRYELQVTRYRHVIDEYRAGKYVELGDRNDEGLKWSKQGREQWLLAMDLEYPTKLEQLQNMESLLSALKGLQSIVFGRDRKLEQLSVNYRRELRSDKPSAGW